MKYAIVESGGKQYRAVEGGTLEVDRLPVEAGLNLKLEQVLLLADGENITVGTPLVADSPVWTKVVEHFKGEKVTIFNYSPKKRIRVKTGHRQNYTRLLVRQIGGMEPVEPEAVEKVKKVRKIESAAASAAVKAEKPVKAEAKKPAAKAPAKAVKAPAAKAKAAPAKKAEKAPAKAAAKPAVKKPAVKKPAAKKPAAKK